MKQNHYMKEQWTKAINNLIERRKQWQHNDDNRKLDNRVRDYKTHISKCKTYDTLLDVGCGSMYLKECVPASVKYTGIDAFPVNDEVVMMIIEEADTSIKYDTICAFAMIDCCMDLDKAIDNMQLIANKNIIFLTGIDIEPDQYHTYKITMQYLDNRFSRWQKTYCEEISPKVYLIEYHKLYEPDL